MNDAHHNPPPQPAIRRRRPWLIWLTDGLKEVVQTIFLLVTVYTLMNLAVPRYLVEGRSMQPVFDGEGNERVMVNRLEYLVNDPQRGDIVVLENPRNTEEYYIKRVVGLPGETVSMEDGQVFINGIQLDEPYIPDLCHKSSCNEREWVLEADQYFVLGDNRNASLDSVVIGPIERVHIIGRAWIHYWPPSDWKLFEHFDSAE